MKDIKKGDYIRTPYGIVKYVEDMMLFDCDCDKSFKKVDVEIHCDDYEFIVHDDEIIKSSPNIIDLIEVGDYVNGVMVTEIKDGKPFKEDYNDPYYSYYFDDIYSIVTKEQFSQMEYRIGE